MTTTTALGPDAQADRELKAKHRAMWALGNYPELAAELISTLGPALVNACKVRRGDRVLDVAAGSGNAAIPAALIGARRGGLRSDPRIVRCRPLPGRCPGATADVANRGCGVASVRGQRLRHRDVLRRGDVRPASPAERGRTGAGLPDGRNHRPAQLDPRGLHRAAVRHHEAVRPPPPPGAQPPPLWGSADHLRELFGDRVTDVSVHRNTVTIDHFAEPADFREYFKSHYGPTIAVYRSIADDPDRVAALDSRPGRAGRSAPGTAAGALMAWEYLLFTGTRA